MKKSVGSALVTFVVISMIAGRMSLFILPAHFQTTTATVSESLNKPTTSAESFSVAFWMTGTASSTARLVWKAENTPATIRGWDITLFNDTIAFEAGDGIRSISATTTIHQPQEKHFIVATLTRPENSETTTIKLYIDGKGEVLARGQIKTSSSSSALFVGSESGSVKKFNGTIENFSLIPKELRTEEVVSSFLQQQSEESANGY